MADETEDVLAFVGRSGHGSTSVGVNQDRPRVLEVHQVWGQTLLDTRHFSATLQPEVTLGSRLGHKWSLLGIDMGWVSAGWARFLPWLPPIWSEVTQVPRADLVVSDGDDGHTLFVVEDGEHVARLRRDWPTVIDTEARRYTLDELVHAGLAERRGELVEVPVRDDMRLTVQVGVTSLVAQRVWEAKPVERTPTRVDPVFASTLGFTGFCGLMLALVTLFAPATIESEVLEDDELEFVQAMIVPEPEPEPVHEEAPQEEPSAAEEEAPPDRNLREERPREDAEAIEQAEHDHAVVESNPLIQALNTDACFGSSNLDQLAAATSGLIGVKGGMFGDGFLTGRGSSLGGGGQGEALGGLGTRGIGGRPHAFGAGGDGIRKREGNVSAAARDVVTLGNMDPRDVNEVLMRHMSAIKFCYQRVLQRDPELSGKVVMKFTISGDGSVSSATVKHTSLDSEEVEQCLVARFLRMQFPKPKGGGLAIISYPFVFASN